MGDGIGAEAVGCDLGDQRLAKRYALLLDRLAGQPGRSIPAACRGRAEVQAAYRFFDQPRVTPDRLLAPHVAATRRRLAAEPVVVVAQDTTEIDLTRPGRVVGGPLGDGRRSGFFSHVLLAATPRGVPLGLLADRTWARDPAAAGRPPARHKRRPLAEKESARWVEGYRHCCAAARALPGVEVVCVSDSEGDVYELFAEAAAQRHAAKFVVRACQPRCLAGGGRRSVQDCVAAAPVLGTRRVAVAKRDAPPSETRRRRTARRGRAAVLTTQVAAVTPRPPRRPGGELPAVAVTVVLAREVSPPEGEEPVEWLLLTDVPAATLADAERVLELYQQRWLIETYFRVLKGGCGVEKLQLEAPGRLLNALALYKVVAWRVLLVTMAGRDCPDLPCDAVLDEAEWKAVYVAVLRTRLPETPPPLGEMVRLIARLGGHLGRTSDPPPGAQAMWIGLQQARTLALGWETFGPGATTYA